MFKNRKSRFPMLIFACFSLILKTRTFSGFAFCKFFLETCTAVTAFGSATIKIFLAVNFRMFAFTNYHIVFGIFITSFGIIAVTHRNNRNVIFTLVGTVNLHVAMTSLKSILKRIAMLV